MALTKISGDVIQTDTTISVGVITATSVKIGSAVTVHSGGFQVGSSDLHTTGLSLQNINASGVVTATSIVATTGTFTGNVSVAGTVTYEDVTNVDSVGVVTARSGINVTGTSTIGNEQLQLSWSSPNGVIKAKNTVGSPAANLDLYSTNTSGNTNLGIRLQYTGNVGIGTDNPTQLLDVHNGNLSVYTPTSGQSIRIRTNNGTIGELAQISGDGTLRLYTNESTPILRTYVSSYGNTYFNPNAGNVGIGSTIPTYTLDVYGTFRSRGTSAPYRYAEINSVGRILSNLANNGNETNLILDNVGDITSTTGHGSNILFRTNDNNSATTAIDSGRISVTKTQQWTSTTSTRNSSLEISLSKGGSLQQRLTINSADARATFFVRQRSNSASEDTSLANHQYLFVEPDGAGPAYYRRSLISEYKGFNQYSYWAIRYDGSSYDYTGSLKCRITWSTSHASGAGFGEFSLAVRSGDSDGGPINAGNVIQYGAVQYSGGWYYGWTVNPDFDVYRADTGQNQQFLVLRLNGYMNHNGGTYDGGVHETVDLESWGNAFQGIYRIGTSAPSGYTLNAITKTILS